MLRKRNTIRSEKFIGKLLVVLVAFSLASCDVVPKETIELSNTVGRDLEEVHRAHRSLAELHFSDIERNINRFIDETYRPAFIKVFASEYDLNKRIEDLKDEPNKLLSVLTGFVQVATQRVEKKRSELINPIQEQKKLVISEIDAAHRQIQAAQAVVTRHLASVRKVRNVQNELLARVGLKSVGEKVAEVSQKVGEFVTKGKEIDGKFGNAAEQIAGFDTEIKKLKAAIIN